MIWIWEYDSGRCISIIQCEMSALKCVSFSPNGNYLATAGKDINNWEQIVVWDIEGVYTENKPPNILAKQVSDFNILTLKFSPFDNLKMASCGKENIRFWRIKNKFIQGSAVVLNQHAWNTIFTDLDFENGFKSSDPVENE